VGTVEKTEGPVILLGATTWWHSSARLAIALIRHGCKVSAVCPPGHPLRFVRGVHRLYQYHGLDSLGALKSAILDCRPDAVVPCNDGVVWQLHDLHAQCPELRPLIERSLGLREAYATIRSRALVLKTAAELGIRIPVTETVASEADLQKSNLQTTTVLKLDGTWGGKGVEIAHSPGAALEAFRDFTKQRGIGFALKRLLINRDPLALWLWQNRTVPEVTIQRFVPGRPANTMFVAREGEVLSSVTVEVISSQGATGAATVVRVIQNAEISEAVHLLARKLKLSGFHGLDFILEEGTGAAYLIELNPRCTQLGHLRILGQCDLSGVFAASLRDLNPPMADDSIVSDTIAFVTPAYFLNPPNLCLHGIYHDAPWQEPDLLWELLQEPWPDRQLLARVWHFFRPPQNPKEVRFETASHPDPEQMLADEAVVADTR
jgi:hypothetical protein